MNRYSIYILGALMVWGCHGNTKTASGDNSVETKADTAKHVQSNLPPLAKGTLIDSVHCADQPGQVYSIYIPSGYSSAKKWPVIYFLDPHGVGNLPLRLYKALAEKYGFVIAGTYGSKNGMQIDASVGAAGDMMSDVAQRVSIDNARIYTFGFSGGARVASALALNGGIAGVIACGGGFPQSHPQISQPFSMLLFVGEKDFNYIELKELDRELDNSPLTHQLMVFHGKHQWPPVVDIEQAFQWMDLCAMRSGTMVKNDSIIKSVQQELDKEAEKNGNQDKDIHEYFASKKLLNFLRGLTNTDKYVATVNSVQATDKFVKYTKDENESEVQEARTQQFYIDCLSNKDAAWWKDRLKDMHDVITKDSALPAALQTQRLLSYLSLAVYMGASHAFSSPDDAVTARFLSLYGMVDPTNPEHSYLFASLYARENDPDKALTNLKEAVSLGFTDLRRLQFDPNFNSMKDNPSLKEIEKKMASAPTKIDVTQ